MKTQVLEEIGETALSRWAGIDAALAANDRIKYYFSLLQTAAARADHPEQKISTLQSERLASGVANPAFDDLVSQSRRENGHYMLPGCHALLQQVVQDLRVMAAPVLAKAKRSAASSEFAPRLESLVAKLPDPETDVIDASAIDDITSAGSGRPDSLHRLVMDLHKALNAMQAELSEEHLDGAVVCQIEGIGPAADRSFHGRAESDLSG